MLNLNQVKLKAAKFLRGRNMNKYCQFFGFVREPFVQNIETKDLLQLPGTLSVKQRMDYILDIGGMMIITGDVGSGKSTSIRWGLSHYHVSEILSLYIVANTGSIAELYKQLAWAMDLNLKSGSKSLLVKELKAAISEIFIQKKQKILITIDEASLLRSDVLAELHTLMQFSFDSKSFFSLILAGQVELLDKLSYRNAAPLASRVISRAHLSALSREQMEDYLNHHLRIAGIKKKLFAVEAITAIHQGSGGVLRKANALARGALIACMIEETDSVNAEHVRQALTEII
jgi:type II secretory pathway predicted ATPase ExeA